MARSEAQTLFARGPARSNRPDPTPYVPSPSAQGAPASTGELAALSPTGSRGRARAAFFDFVRCLIDDDDDCLLAMLAPSVALLGRSQLLDRAQVVQGLRSVIDRSRPGLDVEEVIDTQHVSIRELDAASFGGQSIREHDLLVSAALRPSPALMPSRIWGEDETLAVVLRFEAGRFQIVALGPRQ